MSDNKMTKEDIVSELKTILKDSNGYDIDPYIIHKLVDKITDTKKIKYKYN